MTVMHYRKSGKGPFVIILHGLYGMSDNWIGIARQLSEKYTVIVPDIRNHGRSFHHPEHSYQAMVQDLENLIAELGIAQFILMGHSMGGKVAMQYALRHPEKLNGLIIVDIAPVNYSTEVSHFAYHKHVLKSLMEVDPTRLVSRNEAFDLLSPMLPDEKLLNFLLKNLGADAEGKLYWLLNIPVLLQSLPDMAGGFENSSNPESVSGFPVFFLKGEKSDYIISAYHQQIMQFFPAAEIIPVPNAGHWLHQENPEAVSDIFKTFSHDAN